MRDSKYKIGLLLILMGMFLPVHLFAQQAGEHSLVMESLQRFWAFTSFANFELKYLVMIVVGLAFIWLGIAKNWEPLLLVPIGFGILVGNVPFAEGYKIGIYEQGSVLNILYSGVINGWYPPLIFLGIGAMTDFSTLIANPKLLLIGAAAQIGIFVFFFCAYALGFTPE